MRVPPVALSIAGFDPSSGAGITADIKTAAAFDCYAVTAVTALTVQSTQGVFAVEPVRPEIIRQTLDCLRQDFDIAAVRIGMLGSAPVAEVVADFLENERLPNIVVDPVIRSSSGAALIDEPGLETIRRRLLPLADLITPNADEAALLTGLAGLSESETSWDAAQPRIEAYAGELHRIGSRTVLVTGGHLREPVDFLSVAYSHHRSDTRIYSGARIEARSTHGTGCALAMAVACCLAKASAGKGIEAARDIVSLDSAITSARQFVSAAIEAAYPLGKGIGPINHLSALRRVSE